MRRVALPVVLALALTSCGDSEPPPPAPRTLTAAIRSLGSLDPLSGGSVEGTGGEPVVMRQVFEGLVSYDPLTLEPRPALASGWSVDPEGRTFTFLLRSGARFHNGREVGLDDVLFSLNRLARAACAEDTSPVSGAPSYLLSLVVGYAEVAGACTATELAGLTAVGSNTLMVSLTEPWADFPTVLGHPATSVLPREELESDRDFAHHPVGTGPYAVERPWDGNGMRLERFDGWWGEAPEVESVAVTAYREDSLAYLDLLQSKIHYAPVPAGRAREARRRFGDGGSAATVGLYTFGYNLRSQRMAPLAFRRGLSRAADREAISAAVYEGTRDPALGLVAPLERVDEGPCADMCEFDLAEARRLIAEAYPDGPPEIVIGVPDEGSNPAVGEALSRTFARAGVSARVLSRPLLEHVRGLREGDVDLFQFGWIPAYPAPDALLNPLFRTGSADNFMAYSNPESDELLERARSTLDPEERAERFLEAERRILADMPVLPLLWYRSTVALDPRLVAREGGALVDGLGLTSFADLRFDMTRS